MLPTILSFTAFASQLYRSGQAFLAVRQLQKSSAAGLVLEENPGLPKLAKALNLHLDQARDVWTGAMSTSMAAKGIVSAQIILQTVSKFAWLSPSAGQQARAMAKQATQTRHNALQEAKGTADQTLKIVYANMGTANRLRRAGADKVRIAQAMAAKNFTMAQMREICAEIRTLESGF